MSQVRFYEVTADEAGQRVDNYLSSRLKGVPKSMLYRIIRKGEVRVNKGRVKPDTRLCSGDSVRVPPVRVAESKAPPKLSADMSRVLSEAVLYDEDGLIILNKPSGIAVHGGSGVTAGLIELLRQASEHKGFLELVHRLDKETSGCIMVARKRSMLKFMQEGLRESGRIQKTYVALVAGEWPKHTKLVDVPLLRMEAKNGDRKVRVSGEGKKSQTKFRVLARFRGYTLVEAKPLTGRTHQIRVHAKHVGCPLVGDAKYGSDEVNDIARKGGCKRLFLHATSLEFKNRAGEPVRVEAPLSSALDQYLSQLPSLGKK